MADTPRVAPSQAYPVGELREQGMLDVGDGHAVYWETRGNLHGRAAVAVHGGPGSGCPPVWAELVDPDAYRIVLFDQRSCGRSTPHASEPEVDLSANTTRHLVADMERLREHLGIERWLLLGGSWGSTLALASAVEHPERVTAIVLFAVTTGRHEEFDWLFRGGLARFFPEQWERLRSFPPGDVRDADVPAAYHRLLFDPDPETRRRAAEEWCLWESATPAWPPREGLAERYRDPDYALAFSRLVTLYAANYAWLEDGELLRRAGALAEIPGVLVNGRFDFQSPISYAWRLKRAWPRAELVIVADAGHSIDANVTAELVRATDRFR
jgi:proline iminopeptidase